MKVLELFSGYGGASFALTKANINHKVIGYSDIEKCANYIYPLNHNNDSKQLGDITLIDAKDLDDFDLLTGGFPCQSFSIAGKREGFKAKNKGNLFFEIIRIAEIKQPKYMLLENVEGILNHDNGKTLSIILDQLKFIGYYVKYKLLYSKHLGTPQNRPRVWFACFLDKKDYDNFMFPEKEKLKITVKDLLDDEVDEKYYLNENQTKRILENERHRKEMCINNKISSTLLSRDYKDGGKRVMFNTAHTKANGNRFKTDGVSFTLEATHSQSLCIADFRYDEGIRLRKDGISPTLNARKREDLSSCPIIKTKQWRRLTPRECFRLQGFFNDEIKFGDLSNSKLYFLAGNGWDINVASKIFIQMFKGNQNNQKSLFNFNNPNLM